MDQVEDWQRAPVEGEERRERRYTSRTAEAQSSIIPPAVAAAMPRASDQSYSTETSGTDQTESGAERADDLEDRKPSAAAARKGSDTHEPASETKQAPPAKATRMRRRSRFLDDDITPKKKNPPGVAGMQERSESESAEQQGDGSTDEVVDRKRVLDRIYSKRKRIKRKAKFAALQETCVQVKAENDRLKDETIRVERLFGEAKEIVLAQMSASGAQPQSSQLPTSLLQHPSSSSSMAAAAARLPALQQQQQPMIQPSLDPATMMALLQQRQHLNPQLGLNSALTMLQQQQQQQQHNHPPSSDNILAQLLEQQKRRVRQALMQEVVLNTATRTGSIDPNLPSASLASLPSGLLPGTTSSLSGLGFAAGLSNPALTSLQASNVAAILSQQPATLGSSSSSVMLGVPPPPPSSSSTIASWLNFLSGATTTDSSQNGLSALPQTRLASASGTAAAAAAAGTTSTMLSAAPPLAGSLHLPPLPLSDRQRQPPPPRSLLSESQEQQQQQELASVPAANASTARFQSTLACNDYEDDDDDAEE